MKPFPIDTQKKDESQPPVYSLLAPFGQHEVAAEKKKSQLQFLWSIVRDKTLGL